jgi:hypothetical protein
MSIHSRARGRLQTKGGRLETKEIEKTTCRELKERGYRVSSRYYAG